MQNNKSSGEFEVRADGLALRKLLTTVVLTMTIPSIMALGWLIGIREPNIHDRNGISNADTVTVSKAKLIGVYIADLLAVTETIAANLDSTGSVQTSTYFPEATKLSVIALDDMGTVDLAPGVQGLSSHIGVDLVRRAFAGEQPPPEVVLNAENQHVLVARSFGNPPAGVVLAELSYQRISHLVDSGDAEGSYQLLQRLSRGAEQVIAGDLSGQIPLATAPIEGTSWRIEFAPKPTWLAKVEPGWSGAIIVLIMMFTGLIAGLTMLVIGLRQLLAREAHALLELSGTHKGSMKLNLQAFIPVAKMLRQLSQKSRRQVVNRGRNNADAMIAEAPADDVDANNKVPVQPTDEPTPSTESADGDAHHPDDGLQALFDEECIQGLGATELTDPVVGKMASAIAVIAHNHDIQTLVVAHDARPSSARIRTTVVKTLLASGRDVIDLGEVPPAIVHYAMQKTNTQSSIMISSDHTDHAVNGLQITMNNKALRGNDLQEVLSIMRSEQRVQGVGRTAKENVIPAYLDQIALDVMLALPLKVVIDCDYGSAAHIVPDVIEALDCEVELINHPENAQRPTDWQLHSALALLGEKVRATNADIGVLLGSNGGRLHTVTEKGRTVDNDLVMMLLARDILERNPGANVVYDVKFTRHFGPFVTQEGGRALLAPSNISLIRDKMRQTEATFGGDFNGRIIFRDRWYDFDDALYSIARLLEVLATASASYDEMIAELPQSVSTPELLLAVDDVTRGQLLRELAAQTDFPGARITTIDGLRLDYADSWGAVVNDSSRSSLSMRFEGSDAKSLIRVQTIFRDIIQKAAPDVVLPF